MAGTDVFPPGKRREVMARIRSSNTGPEREIMRILDGLGVRYVHQARLRLGGKTRRVDFLIPDRRLVIEYRSCFWHGCPLHYRGVKGGILGREWWERKIERNRRRDRELEELLERHGYRLVVIWGHDRGRMEEIIRRITEELHRMGEPRPKVIATGGLAELIASASKLVDLIDPDLTIKGLRIAYRRITGSS